MGGELLENERVYEGNDRSQSSDDQDVRKDGGKSKASAGEAGEGREIIGNMVGELARVVDHFFPMMNDWLKGLTDVRDQEAIIYEPQTLVWVGLVALIGKRGSRMTIGRDLRTDNVCRNLKELCGQADLKDVPHGDTADYFFTRSNEAELEEIPGKMVRVLLRKRVLEQYRLQGEYHTLAIDAVHAHTFGYEHCEHCLHCEDKVTGRKWWMHVKLQASLVTPTGLCLPVASEWVENEAHYVKQDCELKACHRLIGKIRRQFPLLPICVLLDGLYANQPIFDALKAAEMEWIVVLKEGSMPYIYEWVMSMKRIFGKNNVIVDRQEEEIEERQKRDHRQRLTRTKPQRKMRARVKETTYTWMAGVECLVEGMLYNMMTCKETVDDDTLCNYVWLVSNGLGLNGDTVRKLAQRGRCRWKIENEGFNTQKNGGYAFEHLYSRDKVSMKVWYALIDIAHIISQLIERGSSVARAYGSVRVIARKIFEHFQYFIFKRPVDPPRIQIRLSWNTS